MSHAPHCTRQLAPLLCLLVGLGARAPARAEPRSPTPARRGNVGPRPVKAHITSHAVRPRPAYDALVDQALGEYRLQHFAEAHALFARAHALRPSARTLRGLAAAAFEMRDYASSVIYLKAALRSKVQPLTGALRKRSQQLLDRARGFVGTVVLRVQPSTAEISIDDQPVPAARWPALHLNLGSHQLEARAPGYQARLRRLEIRGGELQRLDLTLHPRAPARTASLRTAALTPTPNAPRRHEEGADWYESPWLWAGLGITIAGALTAALVIDPRAHSTPTPGGSTGTILTAFRSSAR